MEGTSEECSLEFTHSGHIDPFRRHCSLLTLQTDPKGHFAKLLGHLRKATGNYVNILLQISQLKDDPYEMLRFAANVEGMAIFLPRPVFKGKSDTEASAAREKGNEFYKKGHFKMAFVQYSVAVIKANYPGLKEMQNEPILAFSVGNRSACLFHQGLFEAAINDIHFALSLNYPKANRHKLYERLGLCHLELHQPEKAKTAFAICKQMAKTKEESSKYEALVEKAKNLPESPRPCKKPIANFRVEGCHATFTELSNKVEVKSDPQVGRHIVATEDIKPFETILVEDPVASVLFPSKAGLNCTHCLARLTAAIPCQKCSGSLFCSAFCRDEAAQTYHQWECEFQEVLTGLGCSSVARLSLRLITSRPIAFFLEHKETLLPKGKPFSKEEGESTSGNRYLQLLSLVALEGQRWPEDFLARSAMAVVLLGILRASGYFGGKKTSSNPESYTPNELFIGSLILRHLQILQFNAHEIHEVLRGSSSHIKPYKNVAIALAVYPSAALINHSCHGSLARSFTGARMVLKALRPTKAGIEVCDNYGPTFYLKSRSDRRKELSAKYWFECQCPPCVENWPLLAHLPKKKGGNEDISMEEEHIEDTIATLVEILNANDVYDMPSEFFIRIEDKLRTCVNNYGNVVIGSSATN